ncbi:MmcQ/YjbR family DNA-binding protein [Moraxella marmotae]|uniref:MmcQ/YjbR family DNA-binding protein n=1 Tax=Moraxella marmotae TaxID=3344520 RepID=UPI0035F2EF85
MNKTALIAYIQSRYDTTPDYLFAKHPTAAVFRHKNGKWFALLTSPSANKLGLSGDDCHDIINPDIINLKVPPEQLGSLLAMPGFLPAYHMNKEHWVSALIDVADEKLLKSVLDDSFYLTSQA